MKQLQITSLGFDCTKIEDKCKRFRKYFEHYTSILQTELKIFCIMKEE